MFVVLVVTLVRVWGQRLPDDVRVVDDPAAAGLLDIREAAELLETSTRELLEMVRRDAIPFYLEARVNRSNPSAYWFRRSELDEWVIG